MIRKKPARDLIRVEAGFPKEIMLKQKSQSVMTIRRKVILL